MSIFNKMYRVMNVTNLVSSFILLGCATVYFFTHEPYVPMERETTPSQADMVTLKIREVGKEIHEGFKRLETKLDPLSSLIDQKNSVI